MCGVGEGLDSPTSRWIVGDDHGHPPRQLSLHVGGRVAWHNEVRNAWKRRFDEPYRIEHDVSPRELTTGPPHEIRARCDRFFRSAHRCRNGRQDACGGCESHERRAKDNCTPVSLRHGAEPAGAPSGRLGRGGRSSPGP